MAEIAADGDLILVVGPENVKIFVHSTFLKAASKPFSAMLGPDWKEGQNILDRDVPMELSFAQRQCQRIKTYMCHHPPSE
jgi:hypothetical protein